MVTLEQIERELIAQDEQAESLRKQLTALDLDTQVVLGESFVEQMQAIDARIARPRPAAPAGVFIRI